MKQVGIIGYGSFGSFLAEKLDEYTRVLVYSSSGKDNKWRASLEKVLQSDFVILCVPLEAYGQVLRKIKSRIDSNVVLVDVCSVKEKPIEIIKRILPSQPILSTHPLFGPESANKSLLGHTIVFCREQSSATNYAVVKDFCEQIGLKVVEITAEVHDREMALVHGLTFFIAHGLKDMYIKKSTLITPSFKKLLDLAEIESHHSIELFRTIQEGNRFAGRTRRRFLDKLTKLDEFLNGKI